MTSINNTMNNATLAAEARPEHHVHKSSEPLPGARGGAPAADYSAGTIERMPSSAWQDADPAQPTRETSEFQSTRPDMEAGRNAFSDERPVNTESHPDGGVAIDGGHDTTPAGKPSAADKLIGKAQKVVGKVAHKPEMQEKGELRETAGKAATMAHGS
ncbi:hypothetical protein B0H17DRAFT_1093274 [Mycena rosella]|uniref:CsbD-like domain-containing protein n=1 Tax=Mycena rosella TaxID=1033263 RepID=A0AAD7G5Y3_MYCRO|nr:hypothetical protein B0H17DRAFT_1093274 [Mycena rosella]